MFKEIKATDIKENIVDLLKNNWGLVTAGNSEKYNMMTVSWGAMGELWGKDSVTVYIRPQRALLHPAVRHAGKAHELAELFEIFDRLLCAVHIRLADYFEQRHSAAVAVDERAV